MSRLHNARIRSKLGLILIIPLIAVIALATVRLVDSVQEAFAADLTRSLAEVSTEVAAVSHALTWERMEAARLLADPERESSGFSTRTAGTDEAIDRLLSARNELGELPPLVQTRLTNLDEQLDRLEAIRSDILAGDLTVTGAMLTYSPILTDLVSYQESVTEAAGDPELAESTRALAALARAKNHVAQSQAVAFDMLTGESPGEDDVTVFLSTQTGQQEALLDFTQSANAQQLATINSAIGGGAMILAEQSAVLVTQSAAQDELFIDGAEAVWAFGSVVDLMRFGEKSLHEDQVVLAGELRDDVFRQVLLESVAVLLALLLALTLAALLARMLARSLARLREHALTVADRELPETVARLSDPSTLGENTPAQLAGQVREPTQLRGRDEVGEVAQSFTVVHRAAVRIAAEQAALRTSVSAMFLNLARRSQALVDRMISQLDEIERHEEDPKRLQRMFVLDHLATRMRRNDENLLTLAGADSSPPRSEDAPVPDVLRAAQSEVEHYARIEFGTIDSDVSVAASAVNDVVRLSAELFDNATRFSPPDTPVVCEARRLGDQVIIQIEDRGVGMAPDQLQRLNDWLAAPPDLDVTTFRKMGLAVVARLASRHGIRVELRCDPSVGTIAYVALPRAVLMLPASRLRYAEIPSPRSPMAPTPELPAAPAPPPPPPPPSVTETPTAPGPSESPAPSRHLGQLPRRSPAVVHHAANRRSQEYDNAATHAAEPAAPSAGAGVSAGGHTGNNVDMPIAGRPMYEPSAPASPAARPAAAPQSGASAPEATVELPIFKEMEAVWFRSHGDLELGQDAPRAGAYPASSADSPPAPAARQWSAPPAPAPAPPPAAPPPAAPPPAAPPPASTGGGYDQGGSGQGGYRHGGYDQGGSYGPSSPSQGTPDSGSYDGYSAAATEPWRTAADSGWRAAAAAAQPPAGGATRSGLPKRVPQAQLVPGSVETPAASAGQSPNQRRSPEEVRGLLAAYHRGVQRGRESGGTQ